MTEGGRPGDKAGTTQGGGLGTRLGKPGDKAGMTEGGSLRTRLGSLETRHTTMTDDAHNILFLYIIIMYLHARNPATSKNKWNGMKKTSQLLSV